MQKHHDWVLFAVPLEVETEWEQDIFGSAACLTRWKIFYLVINPRSRPLFSRNGYVGKQETFYF